MSVNVEMRKGACDYVLENRTRAVIVKVRRALSHPPGKKKNHTAAEAGGRQSTRLSMWRY